MKFDESINIFTSRSRERSRRFIGNSRVPRILVRLRHDRFALTIESRQPATPFSFANAHTGLYLRKKKGDYERQISLCPPLILCQPWRERTRRKLRVAGRPTDWQTAFLFLCAPKSTGVSRSQGKRMANCVSAVNKIFTETCSQRIPFAGRVIGRGLSANPLNLSVN